MNEAVKQTENRHRLEGYQKRLDTTSLERASNPLAAEFKVRGRGQHGHRTRTRFWGTLDSRTRVSAWSVGVLGLSVGWRGGAQEHTYLMLPLSVHPQTDMGKQLHH